MYKIKFKDRATGSEQEKICLTEDEVNYWLETHRGNIKPDYRVFEILCEGQEDEVFEW